MNKKIKILIGCIAAALLVGVVATIIIVVPLSVHGTRDARYQEALDLMDEAEKENSYFDYYDAIVILEEVKQHGLDVDDDIIQCHYAMAVIALYDGNDSFSGAIEHFEAAGDYKDAPELLKEAYYQQGFVYLKDKDFQRAYNYFSHVASQDYKNSEEMMDVVDDLAEVYWQDGRQAFKEQINNIGKYMQ